MRGRAPAGSQITNRTSLTTINELVNWLAHKMGSGRSPMRHMPERACRTKGSGALCRLGHTISTDHSAGRLWLSSDPERPNLHEFRHMAFLLRHRGEKPS